MRNLLVRRVAILCPDSAVWTAPILGGIRRYAHAQNSWHLFISPFRVHGENDLFPTLRSLQGWPVNGIVTATNEERALRQIRRMKVPAVNLAGGLSKTFGVPRVIVDNVQAGRLAAEHLLSRGLRHLAFFGWNEVWYSEQRRLGFVERAAEAGARCECFLSSFDQSDQSWMERINVVAKWVASLPRPSGIFAVSDYRCQLLMEACREAELRIPEDVAVIGMDNDETICEHTIPTLTSVSRNPDRIGWETAALLDRMMQGAPAPISSLLLEPDGVIERRSTDMLYCSDPVAQRSLDYMRANLKTPFNIQEIAEHVGVSKRTLENRFRTNLQSSPHDYLTRLRVRHAQTLMQAPNRLTVEALAGECGFGTVPAFYGAFRRVTGETPGSFRRKELASRKVASRDHRSGSARGGTRV